MPTVSDAGPAAEATRARTRSARSSSSRASVSRVSPAGVSVVPVAERFSRTAPSSLSNCRIARLSGGWLMCSLAAARPKWSSSPTATK